MGMGQRNMGPSPGAGSWRCPKKAQWLEVLLEKLLQPANGKYPGLTDGVV